MEIKGFVKTTFLDYPDKVASIVFTGPCNFRCPYCHNGTLITDKSKENLFNKNMVLEHLKNKRGIVEGLVITGGEPTLCEGLIPFMKEVKDLGVFIKLDTNGYRPEVLDKIVSLGLVDYIAMDIKNSFDKYDRTVGLSKIDVDKIKESMNIIRKSNVEYEFRTTVIKEIHTKEDIMSIGRMLCEKDRLYLQQYRKTDNQLEDKEFNFYSISEMENFKQDIFGPLNIDQVFIRGRV